MSSRDADSGGWRRPDGAAPDQDEPAATPPAAPPPIPPLPAGEPASGPAAYGTPASPYYGRYGQGFADPPQSQPAPPGYGQPYGQQPYGQPPYGAPPGYGQPPPWARSGPTFRRLRGLSIAVLVLAGLVTVCLWISAAVSYDAHRTIADAVGSASAKDAYDRYASVVALRLPLLLAAWFVTSRWLVVVRENALLLAPQGQRRSVVWCWLGWVMPIVSFWFPKLILDDSIRDTAAAAGSRPPATRWYWTAWVAAMLLQNLQLRGLGSDAATSRIEPALDTAAAIVTTVALVLWIVLVRRTSAIQDRLATR